MEFRVEFDAAQIVAGHQEDELIQRTIKTYENHTVTSVGHDVFTRCGALERVVFPAVKSVEMYAFYYCTALTSVHLPKVESIIGYAFMFCSALERVNFPSLTSISSGAFRNCKNLTAFIIGQSDSVCRLWDSDAFNDTPIADGTGFIYVPDALVEDYKKAVNWSTYAAQIKPLSELSE